ncbi:MAG: SPOR domain-containing protein [Gammaproteobacteria bacterium]|nr:SPOR domain-containing protein [Gammaproteobacteria bacterium]MYF03084.1 SPOR domain-containing protein [Gammaproteobacteria bacterium]MYI76966.1 SPOR domain-containing protein [Gammaproteobacteria bacterium]
MAKQKDKQKQSSSWAPPLLSGIVLGAILVSCVYYFGVRNFDPNTEFLKTFPDVDKTFPNTTFEFPERLEETDPERVGTFSVPEEPQTESGELQEEGVATTPIDQAESVDEVPETNEPSENTETITGYVLQAGAFTEKKHADSFRASLLLEGYNAYTTEISDENLDVQYRVIVGPYDTVQESQEDSQRLKERNVSTFVVPMREVSE